MTSVDRKALAALMLLGASCYVGLGEAGQVDEGDASGAADDDGADDDADDGADGDPADACGAGTAALRRLTRLQHRYVVEDLLELGDADDEALSRLDFLPDGEAGGFAAMVVPPDLQVTRSHLLLAEDLADLYVERLPTELACDWADAACVRPFVESFGRRAFRRPLDAAELDAAWARHADIATQDGPEVAMQTTVTALLSSPSFLYLEEPATIGDGELAALEPFAVASRLSFLLWSSAPDDELLDAAEADALSSDTGVRAQVERMIADPRFTRTLHSFHEQWTEIDDLAKLGFDDPAWTPTTAQAMRDETLRFVEHVFHEGDGRIATLLAADFSFVDAELAALYGVPAPATPFARTQLDPTTRAGVLTHGSVLARFGVAFPEVHRGRFVRQRLLCGELPPPPGDVELDPQVNRLETAPCNGCHQMMDPIGYGFARYDGLGRHRDVDGAGAPIDDRGDLGAGATFTGVRELADMLATSEEVERCFARQWTRYATGRIDVLDDSCAIDEFTAALATSDGDLRELVVEIATSTWFRSRSASEL